MGNQQTGAKPTTSENNKPAITQTTSKQNLSETITLPSSNLVEQETPTSNTPTTLEAPELGGSSTILKGAVGKSIAQQLRNALPTQQKFHNQWNMLYSNKKNGASIATFAEIVM